LQRVTAKLYLHYARMGNTIEYEQALWDAIKDIKQLFT